MYIPKDLLGCCAKDATRPAINFIYVDVEHKMAVATDGRILATLPITVTEEDASGYISTVAVEYAAKHSGGVLTHSATCTSVNGVQFPNPFTGAGETAPRFPDWQGIAPTWTHHEMCVDAEQLFRLAKAVCGSKKDRKVRLWYGAPHTPVKVFSYAASDEQMGLLMPLAPSQGYASSVRTATYRECLEEIERASRDHGEE